MNDTKFYLVPDYELLKLVQAANYPENYIEKFHKMPVIIFPPETDFRNN